MRKRNRIILWSAAVLAVVAGAFWLIAASSQPEPVYNGHPLSYWVSTVPGVKKGFDPQLDSNAVPFLIQTLKSRDGPARKAYLHLYPHLPPSLRTRLGYPLPAAARVAVASRLLVYQGPGARPAIPELVRMLNPADDRHAQTDASYALSLIANRNDTEVIEAFMTAAKDKDPGIREAALRGLYRIDPEAAAQARAANANQPQSSPGTNTPVPLTQ